MSVADVDEGISDLRAKALFHDSAAAVQSSSGEAVTVRHVWVHLGVHGGIELMHLEQRAYNEMDFLVPDERGFQPARHTPIEAESDAPPQRDTRVPVDEACAETSQLVGSGHIQLSLDPGRFLCNYIFFRSLEAIAAREASGKTQGLQEDAFFLHVPPFAVQPLAIQVRLLSHLLHHIAALATKS